MVTASGHLFPFLAFTAWLHDSTIMVDCIKASYSYALICSHKEALCSQVPKEYSDLAQSQVPLLNTNIIPQALAPFLFSLSSFSPPFFLAAPFSLSLSLLLPQQRKLAFLENQQLNSDRA